MGLWEYLFYGLNECDFFFVVGIYFIFGFGFIFVFIFWGENKIERWLGGWMLTGDTK